MDNIRPARAEDHSAIIKIWHAGWHDAHAHLVPEPLLKFREIEHFWLWLEGSADQFFVATSGKSIVGFVATNEAELVKLYVASGARGTGIAAALLAFGERNIADSGVTDALLYSTAGNTRAERFYRRNGWVLSETFQDALWLPEKVANMGVVDTHRFNKHLG
ncbi:GNAT family N-acetyltransferase [Roseovarius arcticus]|uniref:GNAT family N-acetyltransferase n=1 Tax=Roseovarius arcticus TaxID=2547404 RepID=UPI00111081B0|nr:GNAT family N-acetyltransferase [Roseovarius arcticus]